MYLLEHCKIIPFLNNHSLTTTSHYKWLCTNQNLLPLSSATQNPTQKRGRQPDAYIQIPFAQPEQVEPFVAWYSNSNNFRVFACFFLRSVPFLHSVNFEKWEFKRRRKEEEEEKNPFHNTAVLYILESKPRILRTHNPLNLYQRRCMQTVTAKMATIQFKIEELRVENVYQQITYTNGQ